MSSLAERVNKHLSWDVPLQPLLPLRFDGTHSWLTDRIDVFIDFDWKETIGHGKQTFRHYMSLSNFVRSHSEKTGRPCALVLTSRSDTQEGLDTTFDSHDIFVINVVRYKQLEKDAASAYFAGLSGAPLIGLTLTDRQIRDFLDRFQDHNGFVQWLTDHPEVGVAPNREMALQSVSTDSIIAHLTTRLKRLSSEELGHLRDLVSSDLFPLNVLEAASLSKRKEVVEQFKLQLERNEWKETEHWQPFFKEHSWIFGHGLLYHVLEPVDDEVLSGGKDLSNLGGLIGDYAVRTAGENASFLAFVEIKTPSARLVGPLYRNHCHGIHPDLAGPVSQIIGLCDFWNREGSKQEDNIDRSREEGWLTAEPRGILVIGHTKELDTKDKRRSFEMFRRHLHGIEVLTFDELCKRAEAMVTFYLSPDQRGQVDAQNHQP